MGFKPMIKTFNDPGYYPNALVFGTHAEAEAWAKDLLGRWLMAEAYRVDQVDEEPTHSLLDGRLVAIERTHEHQEN